MKVTHSEQLIIWAKRESCDAVRVIDQNAAAHHCISSALLSLISTFTSQLQFYNKQFYFFTAVQHDDTYDLTDITKLFRNASGFEKGWFTYTQRFI